MSSVNTAEPGPLPEDRPEASSRRVVSPVIWLVWPLVYLALRLAAPYVPAPPGPVTTMASTAIFLLIPLLWLRDIARMDVRPVRAVLLFFLLALLWAEILMGRPTGLVWRLPWRGHPDAAMMMATVARPFADLFLITAAAFLGAALSRIIRDPKLLLPVSIVGALVDYWGVYYGTTGYAVTHLRGVVTNLSASIPSIGGAGTAGGVQPVSYVGFGDWFFLTLFLAVVFRYDLSPRRTFWTLLAFLLPAMLLVVMTDLATVPGVVPMAAAVLIVNWKRLRLTREEGFATLYALVMVGAMIGAYTLWSRSRMPRAVADIPAATGTSAANAVDGDVGSVFRSEGAVTAGGSLTLDFRAARPTAGVIVLFSPQARKDKTAPPGRVLLSADGAKWDAVGTFKGNPSHLTFRERPARYARLVFGTTRGPVTVAEAVLEAPSESVK